MVQFSDVIDRLKYRSCNYTIFSTSPHLNYRLFLGVDFLVVWKTFPQLVIGPSERQEVREEKIKLSKFSFEDFCKGLVIVAEIY